MVRWIDESNNFFVYIFVGKMKVLYGKGNREKYIYVYLYVVVITKCEFYIVIEIEKKVYQKIFWRFFIFIWDVIIIYIFIEMGLRFMFVF